MKKCKIEGCTHKYHAKEYCKVHYTKYLSNPSIINCKIEGCNNMTAKNTARGLCVKHYQRFKDHGDPLVLKKVRKYQSFDEIVALYPQSYLDYEITCRSHWARLCKQYYDDKCSECGWDETTCDVDHIIQHSKGGKNTLSNGRVLCPNCHAKKHRKLRKDV